MIMVFAVPPKASLLLFKLDSSVPLLFQLEQNNVKLNKVMFSSKMLYSMYFTTNLEMDNTVTVGSKIETQGPEGLSGVLMIPL